MFTNVHARSLLLYVFIMNPNLIHNDNIIHYSLLQAENTNGNKLSDLVKNCQIINEIKY